jgi:hypothetical protein
MKKYYITLSIFILAAFNCNATDLYITNPSLNPTNLPAGYTTTATCTVNCTGTAPSSVFLGYYLSTDRFYDAHDAQIYRFSMTGSFPQTTNKTLTIPANTTPGNYYIIFYIDPNNAVSETNENNNTAYTSITITAAIPDLIVQNPGSNPTSIPNGSDAATLSCRITNIGSAATPTGVNTRLRMYINNVNYLNGNEIALLPDITVTPILAGNYIDESQPQVSIPYFTGSFPQTKYIIFVADADGGVTEYSETNNTAYVQVSIISPTLTDYAIGYEFINYSNNWCHNDCLFGNSLNLGCPSSNYYSGSIDMGISVKNYGSASYVPVHADINCITCTPQIITTEDWSVYVPAGQTVSCCGYSFNASGNWGNANITYTIDANEQTTENNESNNEGTLTASELMLKLADGSLNSSDNNSTDLTSVFPNPAKDLINITATEKINRIYVLNTFGQLISSNEVNSTHTTIGSADLADGIYYIRIETANGISLKKISIIK